MMYVLVKSQPTLLPAMTPSTSESRTRPDKLDGVVVFISFLVSGWRLSPRLAAAGRTYAYDIGTPGGRPMTTERPIVMPTLVSLLVCDQVIDDKITNKKSAIGLFNTVLVPELPTTIQQMVVMCSLTGIEARVGIQMQLIRDATNEALFRTSGTVESPSRLATVDLVFALRGVKIAEQGPYAFEILCSDELLGRRRFQVLQHRRGGQQGAENQPGQ
jgi:hypothetical protein